MSTFELGKLLRVDLRDVWKHEAIDFTPWLVEHIDLIGEVLGLDLEVVGREQAVGDFAVDILARDLGRNKRVVIENQLEETDHAHLGQLITYAAGLEAGVVVWVSRNVREEHRQALDWLNRGDGASTEYFGVVVELLQIDGSKPAVNLRVVASPNNWSRRSIRSEVRAEIYIDFGQRSQNVDALDALCANRLALERPFGEPLEWERLEGKRACRIAVYRPGAIEDSTASLDEYHQWAVDHLLRFKRVFGPELPATAARVRESPEQNVIVTSESPTSR
jgi:hypothetical protein